MIRAHAQCVPEPGCLRNAHRLLNLHGATVRTGRLSIRGTTSSAVATSNAYISRTHLRAQQLPLEHVRVPFQAPSLSAAG